VTSDLQAKYCGIFGIETVRDVVFDSYQQLAATANGVASRIPRPDPFSNRARGHLFSIEREACGSREEDAPSVVKPERRAGRLKVRLL
jgi:hypothetical protein